MHSKMQGFRQLSGTKVLFRSLPSAARDQMAAANTPCRGAGLVAHPSSEDNKVCKHGGGGKTTAFRVRIVKGGLSTV